MPARPARTPWLRVAEMLPVAAVGLALALGGTVTASASAAPAASAPVPAAPVPVSASSVLPVAAVRPVAAAAAPDAAARSVVLSPAARVLRQAAALRGRPYAYGATGPRSFDCSGFTRYVFARAVGRSLPHSSAAQHALSHTIAKSAIRPGDLVFFVSHGRVYHVAIYAGHGLIWHAPHSGDRVRLTAISTSSWVAGRVL